MKTRNLAFCLAASSLLIGIPAGAGQRVSPGQSFDVPANMQKAPTETRAAPRRMSYPVMPQSAIRSGYCCVSVDITTQGEPENIDMAFCTERRFKRYSKNAVKKYRYAPAVKDGQALAINGQIELVSFILYGPDRKVRPDKRGLLPVGKQRTILESRQLCRAEILDGTAPELN